MGSYFKTKNGKLYHGDCCEIMRQISSDSIDTIITDPPYGLKFMGKKWDYSVPSIEIWQECLRILKPGGTALIFAGSRTQHRMACNVEDAGFILKDCIMWLYGTGFPKATDISKQLDLKAGAERIKGRIRTDGRGASPQKLNNYGKGDTGIGHADGSKQTYQETLPTSPEAKLWNGWKSHGLKPAYEPIIWAHKPLTSSNNYDSIIVELNNYMEVLLWQSLARLGEMDTSSLQEMALTLLSIASLWKNILEENSTKENKFITLTKTGLITELRTLKFLTLEHTPVRDIHERSKVLGLPLSVYIVGKCLTDEKKNTPDILKHIVQELAISKLKESGMFAEIVKNNSLPTILNKLNIALLDATTSLKRKPRPAYEPILVCMKPNDGSYADNALKWGVSGLNIDGGRIPLSGEKPPSGSAKRVYKNNQYTDQKIYGDNKQTPTQGRYPANIILDKEAACLLDEQSGVLTSGAMKKPYKYINNGYSLGSPAGETKQIHNSNQGGASRFFYCAKASKSERNAGCEKLENKASGSDYRPNDDGTKGLQSRLHGAAQKGTNHHPTVKPLKLIEYLCELTKTPTGGIVIDPFFGSGTTAIACERLNRRWIGIERELEYCDIAKARIQNETPRIKLNLQF